MGGILGACNAISDYLHTLNMGSTLFRLILAMFLGCLIGIDRGMKKRVAGVKTHMIVCMGATLVMMTGDFIHVYSNGAGIGDTARLGAQVVSGIGFLGVGTIIVTGQRHVSGLTTAASLWTSACIGLAVGIGFYSGAIFTTLGLILVFKYAKYIEVKVSEEHKMYRKALTRAWKRLGYSDELAELRTQIICTGEESELEWLAEQVRNRQFRREEKACAYKLVGDVRMKQGQTREAFANYKKALEYEMPSYVRTELYRIFINDLNDGSRQAKSFGKKTDITVVLDKWLDKYESIEDIKKIVQTVTVK